MMHETPLGVFTQHAPVCGAQVLFVQVVPGPRNCPCRTAQSACVVTTHVIAPVVWMQHAPVAGGPHWAVLHEVPSPRYTPFFEAQCDCVVWMQCVPLGVVTQHAPVVGGGAQIVLLHAVALPR
jgi:hypothetical protein